MAGEMEFFGQVPVSNEQAALIAHGLYALSRVDGHDEREGMLIHSLWMDAVGWNKPLPVKQLEADISFDELSNGLPTPELRRLFIKTAILLAWADSSYSKEEKTWIEKAAKTMGIDPKELARMDELVRTWLLAQLSHISNTDATKEVAKKLGF